MATYTMYNFRGFQVVQVKGEDTFSILKNADMNNPVKSGFDTAKECEDYIMEFLFKKKR